MYLVLTCSFGSIKHAKWGLLHVTLSIHSAKNINSMKPTVGDYHSFQLINCGERNVSAFSAEPVSLQIELVSAPPFGMPSSSPIRRYGNPFQVRTTCSLALLVWSSVISISRGQTRTTTPHRSSGGWWSKCQGRVRWCTHFWFISHTYQSPVAEMPYSNIHG